MLLVVRRYCRYGVSYGDFEQMMAERGTSVDHSTIYRWVQKYAPEIEKRLRWQWRCPKSTHPTGGARDLCEGRRQVVLYRRTASPSS